MTGADLRRRRIELGLEQIHVAKLAGVDNGDLCRTEYDRPRGLNAAGVARVVAVLRGEQARGERAAYEQRIGEVAIGVLASEGADCERHEYLLRVGEAACRVLASEAK